MRDWMKVFSVSVMGLGLCAVCGTAVAATARGANTGRAGASMRMPSMPVLPITAVGNITTNIPSQPTKPVNPPKPDDPDVPDIPNPPTPEEPKPECPDGGVKNSEYTVTNCMNDVLSCINQGGLPNGINDLFNEDLRNSIENGMALCSVQVEKCVHEIRRDCKNIYRTSADVWIDFNARKVQPEYYNFVLRKTGLTPNQAENTCLLLDRNTYGPSFAAVANNGATTAEYNKQIGAYNGQQGNVLIKNNPQGATVNSGHSGVDGGRGHYARWDATTADCYLRVAAYNKDSAIKNSWLFGAAGNDKPAEVWRPAGDTFSCNKDLFGFSLMNDTSTVAVVGIGGGTLVGAGVGALAGHGARDFDCSNDGHRKKLAEQLRNSGQIAVLNEYLMDGVSVAGGTITVAQCRDILEVYELAQQALAAASECDGRTDDTDITTISTETTETILYEFTIKGDCAAHINGKIDPSNLNAAIVTVNAALNKPECANNPDATQLLACLNDLAQGKQAPASCGSFRVIDSSSSTQINNTTIAGGTKCSFKNMNRALAAGDGVYCTAASGDCVGPETIRRQANKILSALGGASILQGEKNNRVKTTLVGAGIGAGAGGIATGITALVEKNNINCRVGDGLEKVGYGKSHSIGTLKDFYVKWNLRLPDTIAPTGLANDCNSWRALCRAMTDTNQCKAAQINYRGANDKTITLVHSACLPSGSMCIENYSVAKSYGACE